MDEVRKLADKIGHMVWGGKKEVETGKALRKIARFIIEERRGLMKLLGKVRACYQGVGDTEGSADNLRLLLPEIDEAIARLFGNAVKDSDECSGCGKSFNRCVCDQSRSAQGAEGGGK